MRDKKKKPQKQTRIQDLKPKKDAKGGIIGVLGPGSNNPGGRNPGGQGPRPDYPPGPC